MIFPVNRVFVWFFSLSLIPSSDVAPWTVSKLNTSSNLKQIHHALFSIPENLMMQNKVCKVSLFKRTLVFQLYLETVFCIFYFKLWLLYLVWGFFHKPFLAEFKARMYLKRHMAQKIVYHSKVLSLKLLKFFQKKNPSFDIQDQIIAKFGPVKWWLYFGPRWEVTCFQQALVSVL